MVGHMTASLKRIFPDSSPGKLLKTITPDLQQRLITFTGAIEEQLNNQPASCGGFSDTYAALCDFNEMQSREEIQWTVDVQQQLTFLLSRSPSLEELLLEDCGLKLDFAIKMAAAMREHTSSALQAINLSGNSIEDKAVSAILARDHLTTLTHLRGTILERPITGQHHDVKWQGHPSMDCLIKENACNAPKISNPELCAGLLDADWEQHTRERIAERERGGGAGEEGGAEGRCGFHQLLSATTLSVTVSRPSPSTSYSLSPSSLNWRWRERRWRKGEVGVVDASAAISQVRGSSFIPPPSQPLLHSIAAQTPEEETTSHGSLYRQEAPFRGCGSSPGPLPSSRSPASLMEPLPTQGQTLRHYTASRPRPHRTHTQPPSSRLQDPVSKVGKETSEGMGRVDEGVEEFFTKKIIPDYALKAQRGESNPAQASPLESRSTPSFSTHFSSSSENITPSSMISVTSYSDTSTKTPFKSTYAQLLSISSTPSAPFPVTTNTLPTKNIKKKFGDFFAFKRARGSRASKGGGADGGEGEGAKVKRTSIADLIRPLREAREREKDKEREKETGARSFKDANISNEATTEGIVAIGHHLAGDVRETLPPAVTSTTTTASNEDTPSYTIITTSPDATTTVLSTLGEAVVVLPDLSPSSLVTPPLTDQEISSGLRKERKLAGSPHEERQLKLTKRSLREGKSQSLILLTGLEPEDKDNPHSKKHVSESTPSFEQRLSVMLHRMGEAKTPPAEPKTGQSKDEELRKANSEGAILEKPQPPPSYMKPRTMSTSSGIWPSQGPHPKPEPLGKKVEETPVGQGDPVKLTVPRVVTVADPRNPMTALDLIRPDPPILLKPALPVRPLGPLPPKPARLPLPTPAASGVVGLHPSSAPPSSSSKERIHVRRDTNDGWPEETTIQNGSQDPSSAASAPFTGKVLLPPVLSRRRSPSPQDRSEKAKSLTDESLPKPCQHMKPVPQRRPASIHEDALAMTQELKAVLQSSPIRFRNRGELTPCTEDPSTASDKNRAQEGKLIAKEQKEELKAVKGKKSCCETKDETRHPIPGLEQAAGSGFSSSTAQAQQEPSPTQLFSPAAALDKSLSTLERPIALTQNLEKSPVSPTCQKKSPSTAAALAQMLEIVLVSPTPQKKTPGTISTASESPENPQKSHPFHKKKGPSTVPAMAELRNRTQEKDGAVTKQHTTKADQRTVSSLFE
ncbi:F-actin-uncapping protein LRRC16A [Channa argus]|uniref:F-actin-uncapping protein LRRC16A n=1 Tax=Channa argus TaxID=215402 RepID=A0A6G1PGA2_CHAAH|nr:F-actin-uncapping protein LRRC16A [Channa argus]